jgi:uncharacterized protein YqhQ
MKKKTLSADPSELACRRKTSIGGQALIEGLMMIGPDKKAMAVRKPDGQIYLEELPMTRFTGLANLAFIRGSVRMFRQLVAGTQALLRSAEMMETAEPDAAAPAAPSEPAALEDVDNTVAPPEPAAAVMTGTDATTGAAAPREITAPGAAAGTAEQQPQKSRRSFRTWKNELGQKIDRFLTHHSEVMLYLSAIGGILFSVVLFILLPNLLTSGLSYLTGMSDQTGRGAAILKNLIEGGFRIVIFIGYLYLASRMSEIKRVWMYHGAEHKTIACYEAEMPLTVENVRLHSRFHPRCGTAFMFIVILVSIIVFSLVGWWNPWLNLLIRFLLVPVIAGIAYEIIRLAGRYDNPVTRAISLPGLWLQRLTTAEPNDKMIEVAIAAMKAVIPEEEGRDAW